RVERRQRRLLPLDHAQQVIAVRRFDGRADLLRCEREGTALEFVERGNLRKRIRRREQRRLLRGEAALLGQQRELRAGGGLLAVLVGGADGFGFPFFGFERPGDFRRGLFEGGHFFFLDVLDLENVIAERAFEHRADVAAL